MPLEKNGASLMAVRTEKGKQKDSETQA